MEQAMSSLGATMETPQTSDQIMFSEKEPKN
jgi:deoxyribodipyrimidine photo-lyase